MCYDISLHAVRFLENNSNKNSNLQSPLPPSDFSSLSPRTSFSSHSLFFFRYLPCAGIVTSFRPKNCAVRERERDIRPLRERGRSVDWERKRPVHWERERESTVHWERERDLSHSKSLIFIFTKLQYCSRDSEPWGMMFCGVLIAMDAEKIMFHFLCSTLNW